VYRSAALLLQHHANVDSSLVSGQKRFGNRLRLMEYAATRVVEWADWIVWTTSSVAPPFGEKAISTLPTRTGADTKPKTSAMTRILRVAYPSVSFNAASQIWATCDRDMPECAVWLSPPSAI
jgi:hypothetical protein